MLAWPPRRIKAAELEMAIPPRDSFPAVGARPRLALAPARFSQVCGCVVHRLTEKLIRPCQVEGSTLCLRELGRLRPDGLLCCRFDAFEIGSSS
jgi:hypothetical protein